MNKILSIVIVIIVLLIPALMLIVAGDILCNKINPICNIGDCDAGPLGFFIGAFAIIFLGLPAMLLLNVIITNVVKRVLKKNFNSEISLIIIAIIFSLFLLINSPDKILLTAAYSTKNIKFCKVMQSELNRCNCVYMFAKFRKDSSICNELSEPQIRTHCQKEMIKVLDPRKNNNSSF